MEELTYNTLSINDALDKLFEECLAETYSIEEVSKIIYQRDEILERQKLNLLDRLIKANEKNLELQDENKRLKGGY